MLATYMGLAHGVIMFPLYEHLKTKFAKSEEELTSTDILIASNISKRNLKSSSFSLFF